MSALFVRSPGDITESIALQREIEIRQIPFLYNVSQSYVDSNTEEYVADVLLDISRDVSSHWMFTAPIQLILDGPEPAWSKNGWSFVPLDLSNVTNETSLLDDEQSSVRDFSQLNISFTTQAIRGSIECSPIDGLKNLTSWLTLLNFTDTDVWNVSTITPDADLGFAVGAPGEYSESSAYIFTPGYTPNNCIGCTTILPSSIEAICCANDSTASVGYWSPNVDLFPGEGPRYWQRNFTTKWITGPATPNIRLNDAHPDDSPLVFLSVPSISRLNCHPQVEVANSELTVNPRTGIVQAFRIIDTPQVAEDAFADNFLIHNDTIFSRETGFLYYNSTVR